MSVEDFLQGIQRAGADVTEDDTDGADDQRRKGLTGMNGTPVRVFGDYCGAWFTASPRLSP